MKKIRKCTGFTLLEILIVIAILAILATLIGPQFFGQPAPIIVVGSTHTVTLSIDKNPIEIDQAGNSSTNGILLITKNATPPGGVLTAGIARQVTLTVFPHHPVGTVTIAPVSAQTGPIGTVNYTLTTTNYEGGVTIMGTDAASGTGIAVTVSIE